MDKEKIKKRKHYFLIDGIKENTFDNRHSVGSLDAWWVIPPISQTESIIQVAANPIVGCGREVISIHKSWWGSYISTEAKMLQKKKNINAI